jgi:hypothetical protein
MQYLTGWRMHLARRLLRESTLGLAEDAPRSRFSTDDARTGFYPRAEIRFDRY